MGIEPTYSAWKAEVLPLNYTRNLATPPTCTQSNNGGGGRIRTSEGRTSRFTICPLWPLGNPSQNQAAYNA